MNGYRVLLMAVLAWLPVATVHGETSGPSPELRAFERGSLQAIRDDHAGRPFVLALWSVYCEPCREEMATLGRFKDQHPDVAVVLVSTDPPEDSESVRRMLAQYAPAEAETWAFSDAFAERLRYAIDPRWHGELPRTYLYDAAHRTTAVSGRIDATHLAGWINQVKAPQ